MAGNEKLRGVRGWWRGVPVRVADSFLDGVSIGAGEATVDPKPIAPGDIAAGADPFALQMAFDAAVNHLLAVLDGVPDDGVWGMYRHQAAMTLFRHARKAPMLAAVKDEDPPTMDEDPADEDDEEDEEDESQGDFVTLKELGERNGWTAGAITDDMRKEIDEIDEVKGVGPLGDLLQVAQPLDGAHVKKGVDPRNIVGAVADALTIEGNQILSDVPMGYPLDGEGVFRRFKRFETILPKCSWRKFYHGQPLERMIVAEKQTLSPGDTAWSSKPSTPPAPAPVCPPPAPPVAAPGRTLRTPGGVRFVIDEE